MFEVVVGIDFGSYGTGYAYSFNNPKNIELGKFKGQNIGIKVPTQIILDSELKNILSFGAECSQYQLKSNDLYFKAIKMNIYHNLNYIKPENNSRSFPLVNVITKVFEYIKLDAIKSIQQSRPSITEDQIKWIVTVPSIWNLSQRGIMITVCEKAGLFNKNTDRGNFLALEPEAASLYCSYDDSVDQKYLMPGKTYIVCDLGGGTGDIVTHFRTMGNQIIEKYLPIGGAYGSEEIDNKIFNDIIQKIFGFNDFNSLKDKFNYITYKQKEKPQNFEWDEKSLYSLWHELQENIKKNKMLTTNAMKNQTCIINFSIFQDFTDGAQLKDLVNNWNNVCQEGWKIGITSEKFWLLEFPYKIYFDIIESHASKIAEQISEIFSHVNNIESILYVGGYCSNEIIINFLENKFKNLKHLKPSCPERAVVKGAVLFGINPYLINLRKAPYTIGFNCDDNWDESIHGGKGEKYFDEKFNIYKCRNSFHVLVRKGEDLSSKDNLIEQSFMTMNSRIIRLKFFKSINENPVLWTENGVELIGDEQLDLRKDYPPNERAFKLRLKFGGTYAIASCIHEESGKEYSFPLYFNN